MQTSITDLFRETSEGMSADQILRKCVHCGLCLATCPTYNLLGDELDSPRGRIYLIKRVLEGHTPTAKTQLHLDRCLTCRNCETSCPCGVEFGQLVDIGRKLVERQVKRSLYQRLLHWGLRKLLSYPTRIGPVVRLGQLMRPFYPAFLRRVIPARQQAGTWPSHPHRRRMLVLNGCVQPSMAPRINAAAARVLDRLGIQLFSVPEAGCCGALSYHLNAQDEGLDFMRRNIDTWWGHVEAGVEAIVMTASGCGSMVKEYGHVLHHDPKYAEKAARISELCKDLSEILGEEDLSVLELGKHRSRKIAFHSPCSLQHGQQLHGFVEKILQDLGFTMTSVPEAHLCCGSAGTYSILQKDLSQRLLKNKLDALKSGDPQIIATANIGCLLHLQTRAEMPVRHWVELLDPELV